MAFDRPSARWRPLLAALAGVLAAGATAAQAQVTPQTVQLIDRLCSQTLRINEEDRLYGMISLAVRGTVRYRGVEFRPDVIDDAVQDALDGMIEDCPELAAVDESKRLSMALEMISDATTRVIADFRKAQNGPEKDSPYPRTLPNTLTAADLSGELASHEVDQWLESMPPRQRALSLFLYASDVMPGEIAAAIGEPRAALTRQFAASKGDLMRIFREEWTPASTASASGGPAMQFSMRGPSLAALMKPGATPAAASASQSAPAASGAAATDEMVAPANGTAVAARPAALTTADPPAPQPGVLPALRVTGISDDLYAGWSLLAIGRDLPPGQRIAISQPFVLEPDRAGIKRMLVVDIAEIGDSRAATRRFLLKAYAIDGDKEAGGLHETFHVGGALQNEEAAKTLANRSLSSIEVARCLWRDFGTAEDPGLCR
jgi:DNA-directed RNA polymerase specialized sigma24 family protein